MTLPPADIAVLHLVWGPLGPAPLRGFLDSYRAHPAGAEHELVVLLNGVTPGQRPALLAELENVDHRLVELDEPVQDLVAYVQAVEGLDHEHVCFLNSYSTVLDSGWLAKLSQALREPQAGLVGASGSWASLRSLTLHSLSLPNAYRGAVPARQATFEQLQAIRVELDAGNQTVPATSEQQSHSRLSALLEMARSMPSMAEQVRHFEGFPAHHLRTNAFMAQRKTFTNLRLGRIGRKMEAYRLESGRESFTRQIEARGLRALVVDREGNVHDHLDWPATRTFWQGDQERLLVADNQTRIYSGGSLGRRQLLSGLAWGSQADPGSSLPSGGIG